MIRSLTAGLVSLGLLAGCATVRPDSPDVLARLSKQQALCAQGDQVGCQHAQFWMDELARERAYDVSRVQQQNAIAGQIVTGIAGELLLAGAARVPAYAPGPVRALPVVPIRPLQSEHR